MKHLHEMPFGAFLCAEGGADFRLWAPAASAPTLVVHGGGAAQRHPARCEADGLWHCLVPQADATTLYEW